MADKRTKAQLDFDYAKHGWAFCSKAMLAGKIDRLALLAELLQPDDKRHQELERIVSKYNNWKES
jgi:hypothetical protein